MRLLVNGLCPQGNKGGPAIALSLMALLRARLGAGTSFVFAVPKSEIERERVWARRFEVEAVATASLRFAVPIRPRRAAAEFDDVRALARTLDDCDALVEMSAINYVSPPTWLARKSLLDGRFPAFLLARARRRPFVAWTQSLGPFTHPLVRALARFELRRQPVIFCRGRETFDAVRALLPDHPAEDYPDCAVVLPFDRGEGAKLLPQAVRAGDGPLVTISPSAVLYRRAADARQVPDRDNAHVIQVIEACRAFRDRGARLLLVPHNRLPHTGRPSACDLLVSRLVARRIDVPVIEDDLGPCELKSIIANADLHAGARFHSVVASLSSGVPTVSMSWHHKYRDLMRAFGCEGDVWSDESGRSLAGAMLDAFDRRDDLRECLAAQEPKVRLAVQRNADRFVESMRKLDVSGVPGATSDASLTTVDDPEQFR